jgi:hypothetical protein
LTGARGIQGDRRGDPLAALVVREPGGYPDRQTEGGTENHVTDVVVVVIIVLLAVIGFAIAVAVLRWALRINKIVELLTDISNGLKLRRTPSAAAGADAQATEGRPDRPVGPFRVEAWDLSVGDWIEDPSGKRLRVVRFKGQDLEVEPEGGEPHRISPPFNYRKA